MILVDTLEKKSLHVTDAFDALGIPWRPQRLAQGDYMLEGSDALTIDRKSGLQEAYSCLVGKQHDRFKRECQRSKVAGQRLVILIETHKSETFYARGVGAVKVSEPSISDIRDVDRWVNPRRVAFSRTAHTGIDRDRRPPITSRQLMLTMLTFAELYGCEWKFCQSADCGKRIAEILIESEK